MNDCDRQRTNMVESQIRPSDITDRRILRAMQAVPRELFVAPEFATLAYTDEPVPLSSSVNGRAMTARTLMAPRTFAKLVQLAAIEPADRVLIVGAGRGYAAAVIAHLAGEVVALESDGALAASATGALAGIPNVTLLTGDLATGAPGAAAFDVIVLEGAIPERPMALLSRLKDGGRLVCVLNAGGVGRATVWRRVGPSFAETSAFEAAAAPLPGFELKPVFVF